MVTLTMDGPLEGRALRPGRRHRHRSDTADQGNEVRLQRNATAGSERLFVLDPLDALGLLLSLASLPARDGVAQSEHLPCNVLRGRAVRRPEARALGYLQGKDARRADPATSSHETASSPDAFAVVEPAIRAAEHFSHDRVSLPAVVTERSDVSTKLRLQVRGPLFEQSTGHHFGRAIV
ncbi:MAG TPA: hypothetical protein VGJ84_17265 [Polyangiaceae bacterium]